MEWINMLPIYYLLVCKANSQFGGGGSSGGGGFSGGGSSFDNNNYDSNRDNDGSSNGPASWTAFLISLGLLIVGFFSIFCYCKYKKRQ